MTAESNRTADGRVDCADGSSCNLWWNAVPPIFGERVGCIGSVLATSLTTDLVERALEELRRAGCTIALAPMDGNTWRSYRFVTGGGKQPPFFLEPANPAFYPQLFQAAGFAPLSRYSSSLVNLQTNPRLDRIEERLAWRGVTIRDLDPGAFKLELDRLFELSLESFADNVLFTPIDRRSFGELYERIEPFVQPEFVRFAEVEGKPVSFVFAVPDCLEQQRTAKATTLVVKTLATHPHWRHLGIGSVLVEKVQEAALARGFTRAIHALQHEANTSLKITRRSQGERFREYTLFSRSLR